MGSQQQSERSRCEYCGIDLDDASAEGLCRGCLLRSGLEECCETLSVNIRCPYCHQTVELSPTAQLRNTKCPQCNEHFSVIDDLHEQSQSLGRFDLLEVVGAGSFGTVWRARDRELDRIVAVKIPHQDRLSSIEAEEFLREARAGAQLNHPHIVKVLEAGRDAGRVYIASEFVDGINLAERLLTEPVTPIEAARLCLTIAEALDHAHNCSVVHRDIKPSNLVIDRDGHPHITDFGLAKRESGEVSLTVEGKVLGSPAYMSPEQARGDSHLADRRSDVYSLGIVLYEMATGERPFRGDLSRLLHQVVYEDAPALRRLNSRIPRDLDTICLKCLEKDPGKRYATAAELADDLRRYLGGSPIHARPISPVARVWRLCLRNPAVAILTVSVSILLLVLAIGGPFIAAKESAARRRADEETRRVRFIYRTAETHYTAGIELLEKLIAEQPDDSHFQAQLADVYIELAWFLATCPDPELRNPAHAEELALMASRRAPNNARAWRTLGVAQYRQGDWSASRVSLEKCDSLMLQSGGPEWAFLAMAHWQLGSHSAARSWYNKYVDWLAQQTVASDELNGVRDEAAVVLDLQSRTVQ